MRIHPVVCLVVASEVAATWACGDGGTTGPTDRPPVATSLPARFRIDAYATSTSPDGWVVECSWLLVGELVGTPRSSAQGFESEARIGGEVSRSVLRNGSGLAFFADMFGTFTARLTYPDSVEFVDPDVDTRGSRFWEELTRIAGRVTSDTEATGDWTCPPLDITEGGRVDTSGVARGTWSLRATPPNVD